MGSRVSNASFNPSNVGLSALSDRPYSWELDSNPFTNNLPSVAMFERTPVPNVAQSLIVNDTLLNSIVTSDVWSTINANTAPS